MIMIPIKPVLEAIRELRTIYLYYVPIINKQSCLSKPLYTCFVDFAKAFDYIDRTA